MPQFFYRLSTRIYALALLAVGLAAMLTFFMLSKAVDTAYSQRSHELKQFTDIAIGQMALLQAEVDAGNIDIETAKNMARDQISTMRWGSSGYFFAVDTDHILQILPTKPEMVGDYRYDIQDDHGQYLYRNIVTIGATTQGGSLMYHFHNPGTDSIEAKMSYVQMFKPWGWVVGTGAYVSDIDAEMAQMRWATVIALAVSLTLLAIGATLITRSVISPLKGVQDRMRSLANGDTESEIPGAENKSEIGEMARTLDVFRQSLSRQKELESEQKAREQEQAQVVSVLGKRLASLSQGDLTIKIGSEFPRDYGQLRQDFNKTVETLSATVSKMVEATSSIRNGAAEISQASDNLSHRTESQAATLEETAAALDELTASVKSAAEGARSVEATMEDAKKEAESSGEVVQSAVAAMTEIEQSSNHIGQIISVIDDIAFQTNLLALNAGVEAARAGEAGKGFAVVASEVRALAQRSSDAAMEIKTLIGDSSKQVERGVDLVGKAGEALNSIVGQVSHISKLVSGIAEGAVEQSTGLNEINTGVTQLDQVTQQNAAMVEQATAAGHMLDRDSGKLAELVAAFRIDGSAPVTSLPSVAPQESPASPPSAHGADDWDLGEVKPAPAAVSTDGNAAKNLWQDF